MIHPPTLRARCLAVVWRWADTRERSRDMAMRMLRGFSPDDILLAMDAAGVEWPDDAPYSVRIRAIITARKGYIE